jgi:oligopeptide/dipeptide ABC transporter ATP-binding protein
MRYVASLSEIGWAAMTSASTTPEEVTRSPEENESAQALTVNHLNLSLVSHRGSVPIVTDVNIELAPRQILGLVGESGSGKSITSLAIMRLLDDREIRIDSGSICLFGRDLLDLDEHEMQSVRGSEIGMVFQDPMSSLDPAFTVGYQITSIVRRHSDLGRGAARARALELLALVGIGDARRRIDSYPHQLSGGMRQRVIIAMAISCQPKVLIADEPTTALDATTQAQILELIQRLATELNMATLITSHDLGVVAEVCDTVSVMYAGQIIEHASTENIFHHPQHPYTEALLRTLPRVGVSEPLVGIAGQPPRAGAFPHGCRFAPRCHYATALCTSEPVALRQIAPGGTSRCIRLDDLDLLGVRA